MSTLLMDPDRRSQLVERENMHLICPACDWIVAPPEGLLIDRSIRLLEHLDEVHPHYLAFLRIALRAHDRTVEA